MMGTMGAIFKKELILLLESWRFLALALVVVLLSILTFYVRREVYREDIASYRTTLAIQEQRLQENFSLNWPEYLVYKRPSNWSVLSQGLPWEGAYDGLSYAVVVSENPFETLFSQLDMLWIVGVVMSLFALVLAHDSISGEREDGTLGLVLSNSVSRSVLILGKWTAGMGALFPVLALIFLLGALFLAIEPAAGFNTQQAGIWVAMFFISFSYLSLFYLLGLSVSARAHTSATGLWILLAIWIAWVFLVPNISPDLARFILNSPSQIAFKEQRSNTKRQIWRSVLQQLESYKATGDEKQMLQAIGDKEGPMVQGLIKLRREVKKIEDDFNHKAQREIDLSRTLSALSPYACYLYIGTDLADTGVYSQHLFSRRANQYYERWFDWFFQKLDEFMRTGSVHQFEEPLETTTMPRFADMPTGFLDRIGSALPFIGCLLFYNLFFFSLAYGLFCRT